jgi:hypothetical protein
MARLDIRPVICQNNHNGWSHVAILSEQGTIHADGSTPTWIIAISLHDPNAKEIGPQLLDLVNQRYQQSELKTPEIVYQILENLRQTANTHIDIAAIVLLPHQMTLYGMGSFSIELCRHQKCGTVISGVNQPSWQVVEGKWELNDRWWIIAGENKPTNALIVPYSLEQIAEQLQGELISQPDLVSANVLVTLENETGPTTVIQTTNEMATPASIQSKLQSKKHIMIAGWIILLLLVISIWFGSQARIEQRYATAYKTLETQVTEGIAVAESKKTTDQVIARQEFRSVQTAVTNTKPSFEKNPKWFAKWKTLNDQVTAEYQTLAGESSLNAVSEWYALSIINPSLQGDKLAINQDALIVLDKQLGSVVKINLTSKKGETLSGSNATANLKDIVATNTKAYTVAPAGITETVIAKKTTAQIITADTEWLNPEQIAEFNGNVYILDSGASMIWRYPITATGFGAKQNWFGTGVTLPSGPINSMTVDGDLWLLKSGSIVRYRRGAPLTFTISGMDVPLGANTPGFAVATDQDKIAILDSSNQRIVMLNKKGEYQKQIQWSGITNAKDIAITADGATMYVLGNGFIYQIATP